MHTSLMRGAIALVFAAASSTATTGRAQGSAQISVGTGSATDERGVHSNVVSLTPSVSWQAGDRTGLTLAGTAMRFENMTSQLSGSAAVAGRLPAKAGLALTLDAGGSASHTSYDATFVVGEVTPAIEWSAGPITVFVGARAATATTTIGSASSAAAGPGETRLSSVTRSSHAPLYGAQVRAGGGLATPALVLSFREEPTRVTGIVVSDRTAGATLTAGPLLLAATAGQRRASDERSSFGSALASVALPRAFALEVSAGRYPSSRLTGAAGGRFVSAGVSWRIGGGAREWTPPRPQGVPAPGRGVTRLSIRAAEAVRVEVAGDWNEWAPMAATRGTNGVWYVDLALAPGEYRYSFRVDGTRWRVPAGALAVDDEFGGKSAYVTVGGVAPRQVTSTRGEP